MARISGTTKQFSMAGTFINANATTTHTDLTKMAAWSVTGGTVSGAADANAVASIGTATGLVAPVAAGSTQVMAGLCGVNAQTTLYVESTRAVALSTNPPANMRYG